MAGTGTFLAQGTAGWFRVKDSEYRVLLPHPDEANDPASKEPAMCPFGVGHAGRDNAVAKEDLSKARVIP